MGGESTLNKADMYTLSIEQISYNWKVSKMRWEKKSIQNQCAEDRI